MFQTTNQGWFHARNAMTSCPAVLNVGAAMRRAKNLQISIDPEGR
jgi:hypothetical protein